MFEFKLPDLGEGIHEGELLKWYVKEGDSINEDECVTMPPKSFPSRRISRSKAMPYRSESPLSNKNKPRHNSVPVSTYRPSISPMKSPNLDIPSFSLNDEASSFY
ncbi:biotin/lipoyl-containing protein [Desulfobacula sp.]|uniref:biotin/lipoyl-containing protein n=1 Tax=Desulfobacula sp. TaxID=2593537 RepID=UPI0039B88804